MRRCLPSRRHPATSPARRAWRHPKASGPALRLPRAALNITTNTVIELGPSTTGTVTGPGRVNGTYDPTQWVVLFE